MTHKPAVEQALYAQGLHATQVLATSATPLQGYEVQPRAMESGFKGGGSADMPYGDWGSKPPG